MAAAPGTKGKEVGEDEGLASKLTVGLVWAEDGRRGEIDEGGGASTGTAMAAAAAQADSAWVGAQPSSWRGGGGSGEAREVGARGIELRRRGLAGATSTAAPRGSAQRELEEGEEGEGKMELGAGTG